MAGKQARLVYGSRRWRSLRLATLNAADWRCSRCHGYGDEVHHVKAIAVGGDPFEPDNLEVLCRVCHLAGHTATGRPGGPKRSAARLAWHARLHKQNA